MLNILNTFKVCMIFFQKRLPNYDDMNIYLQWHRIRSLLPTQGIGNGLVPVSLLQHTL